MYSVVRQDLQMKKNTFSRRNTLGQRLIATFSSILLLTVLGSAFGLWALYRVNGATDQMVQQTVAVERLVADAYRYQEINTARYKAMALSSEPEVGDILAADILLTQERYNVLLKQLEMRLNSAQEQALLAKISAASRESRAPSGFYRAGEGQMKTAEPQGLDPLAADAESRSKTTSRSRRTA